MSRFGVRGLAVFLAAATMVGGFPASSVAATGKVFDFARPAVKEPKAVPVRPVAIGQGAGADKRVDQATAHRWKGAPKVTWPSAGSVEVDLGNGGAQHAAPARSGAADAKPPLKPGGFKPAGTLPVAVAAMPAKGRSAAVPLSKVKVTVADHELSQRAGVDGLLVSIGRVDNTTAAAPVRVQVNYSALRGAYGGDWSSRLHLVQLPACALTTPQVPRCRVAKPLATTNDTKAGTLSARVDAPPQSVPRPRAASASMIRSSAVEAAASTSAAVLAATSSSSGSSGDYKATPLSPSGSWSAGGSTGAFTWSYPIGVPDVPGGLKPKISLDYNSQNLDGETAASNNQPSWIGDGWDWQPGFIERHYKPCDYDKDGGTNTTKVGDLCWYNDNATLSLGGKSTELVKDDKTGQWHPANDNSEKVEKLTGAANGTHDGEYWKITTNDGTQYYFGLNHLPGWKDSKSTPETNSAWTVPVFGNQSGEPCYNSDFASAWCQQVWRWQLDYVVDPHGDAMAYYWKTESNNYGRDVSDTTGKSTATTYVRGGYLDHIDYGLRSDAVYSGKAMGQVTFGTDERCLSDCSTFDSAHAANWPDVPFDQYCKDGDECKDKYSPTFWTRKRLTSITTKVLTGGAYKNVDSWALAQGFPASGDGISTPMWLQSITHTGQVGGTAALPPVTFAGVQMANRVDKTGDGLAPFIRLRLSQITIETGGTIGVYYSDPGCTASNLPPSDGTNTTTCYPFKWAFEGETAKQDWFNTYTVSKVVEGDNIASTPDKATTYSYLGGAAWAKSTDELLKADDRTYSVARGYGIVQTRTGAGSDPQTLSETRYFRGLDGQDVKDSTGATVTDRLQFAGMVREKATYNGDDTSKLISATSYTPWRSDATATRTRTGLPDLHASHTGTQKEQTHTTISGGVRTTSLTRTFDSYGMVNSVSDLGDEAKSGDERCTLTTYARNTSSWILDKVSRVETVADACDATINRPADVISDKRTYYDGGAFGGAPTKGDVTKTDQINGKGDGYDTISTTAPGDFDIYGRALKVTDTYGKTTTTAYAPATGEAPTQTVVTNPLGQAVTTILDPLRGRPTQVTDANNRVTTTSYDPLGRTSQVWTPAHPAAANPTSPSYAFDYQVRNDAPVVVTTRKLDFNSVYQPSYAFYDGLLRPVQTQAPSPDGAGRLVTETFYDTRGLAWRNSGTYYADGKAEPVRVTGQETNYPASTDTLYDGAGRTTAVIDKKYGDEVKRTTMTYTGDTTTVIPPQGGTATTTVTDARGHTVELKQYTNADRTTSQSTTYTYDQRGLLRQMTDPSGAKWTYTYDVRGRQTQVDDPDKGTSSTVYDAGDRATDVTDARGITLHTDYDALGRPVDRKQGTTTLAAWTYDGASGGKGQPYTTTRYVGGNAYTSQVNSYNALYQPVGSQMTIPTSEGGLAGTYKWTASYNANTGQPMWSQQPAIGDLPQERLTSTYTANSNLPNTLYEGNSALVSAMTYDHYGRLAQQQDGQFGALLHISNEFDEHTGQLTRQFTDRDTAPQRIDDNHYTYDPAGDVTSISTTTGQDTTAVTDTQCFTLDALQRVSEAWTATDQCKTTPSDASSTTVGGPDAYWTSYSYDAVGNRKTEVQHQAVSGPAGDITRTYASPVTGTHELPSVGQNGPDGSSQETFTYDKDGNTATRVIGGNTENLHWDAEGHLADTMGSSTTSYIYDASGNLLIRKDSTGSTLYLPGGNQLHLAKNGTLTGTRYYTLSGQTVAMLTGGKLSFLLTDSHGTATTQVDATTQAVTRRKTTIFGTPRGTQPASWAGDKGFVGGTLDPDTTLIHLGAREYDSTLGRFISVDPLLEAAKPQSINAYTYAENNPVTESDPTGKSSGFTCSNGSCTDGVDYSEAQYAEGHEYGNSDVQQEMEYQQLTEILAGNYHPYIPPNVFDPTFHGNTFTLPRAGGPTYGILDDPAANNDWDAPSLFLGWFWGGGYPLGPVQQFRGGDELTRELAQNSEIALIRSELTRQARTQGMAAPAAKDADNFFYRDRGPEPGAPWYKFNSLRGAFDDILGSITNGKLGTSNPADAFLGSFTGSAQIASINKKESTVQIRFHVDNTSDWNSATHLVPRSWNPAFTGTFGAKVQESFDWTEQWPLYQCMPSS
ncbi:RHS repeat domain-containing protein [Streptomyces silvisoli]|uniref:RHS repeat-associated core domain-containing protein n=1 Tax=Streptomyces silvisoli TaxID=3034235 RepID=A0ABT5ZWZ3_9ACTN|nr:RHS repeat-associated core domain-containing protein [Streptomyces silvisoli]MDF3294342.1 RHS repeat-associated core domain-containing protein [Streptomyces silvisoli]